MRISDWSSDVCSSDLSAPQRRAPDRHNRGIPVAVGRAVVQQAARLKREARPPGECSEYPRHHSSSTIFPICSPASMRAWAAAASVRGKRLSITGRNFPSLTNGQTDFSRSEEHTSELQSLMRITYAVLCLKKNTYHHSK